MSHLARQLHLREFGAALERAEAHAFYRVRKHDTADVALQKGPVANHIQALVQLHLFQLGTFAERLVAYQQQ